MTEETREEQQEEQRSESVTIDNASARQWIRGPLLTFVRWMPLGGSGGAFIAFLFQQEWLIALLLLPVNAVSVVWAAYSKSFLRTLAEIYEERGTEDAKGLIAWIDQTNQRIPSAIQWQLAGVEDKCLTLQGNMWPDFEMEGFNPALGTYTPLLNEVFVSLGLSNSFIQNLAGESLPLFPGMKWDRKKLEIIQKKSLDIWDILRKANKIKAYRRLAIISWGGYGKTTLLRHITYIYTQKKEGRYRAPKVLPVLLLLRQWQSLIVNKKNLTLPQLIENHHIPSLPGYDQLKLPHNWAKKHLENGNILVMIDGFDEVNEIWRITISKWLGKEMKQYPEAYFIVTSRPSGYKLFAYKYKLKGELFIQPFNRHQQERFVQNWYWHQERYARGGRNTPKVKAEARTKADNLLEQLKSRPELDDLAKISLLLNLIVNVHRTYPSEQLPRRRSDLYRQVINLQLVNRPLARNLSLLLPADEAEHILQEFALYMVQKNKPEIDYYLLYNCIKDPVARFDCSVDVMILIQQIVEVSELLVKRDDDYQFAHLSFQGYLAAREIIRTKQEELLIQNWQASLWRETILLYAAQVNPNQFLKALINIGTADAVALAYDCIKETPRKINPEIEKELQELEANVSNLLFQDLQRYLRNGEWQKADEETTRLMLQLGDDENKGYLDSNDLRKFPRDELRGIDQLWVKYSKGKFGFSVQKQIWLDLGGKLGVYDDNMWKEFGNRIGWIKENRWLRYPNGYTFNTKGLQGHLPRLVGVCVGGIEGIVASFLFSKL
ncbi:GUN4 domain-containing protein [Roseofilum reptotaenium CS-1145]|uniref:NACHT domain-containing protein n=1 Tax=Roseofilum reptotaenium AO1-A TaxID=1925591 RepID=A0A1L9QSR6_9CYAN|nr:GUN4 domain-containing protein [Roseofilum reptotaenium]MDB9518877.1 GUN4 domain-containing protein [Roseofilum reptotaenium CS-1145]OJJ25692.1 hypothetical protein BI308_10230 [Roseofilum reptotaenium AO1-A]